MGFKTAGFPHYAFNPVGFRQRGSGIPAQNLIFKNLVVQDEYYEDYVGKFQAPEGHDYRNAHLIGDGITAIYFYAGLDGKTVYFYNIGTSSWVSQTYNHATGVVFGAGVEILEAYSELGDVWTFEEKGCATLYNLKGTDHGYIDASGTALENFRAGRNFLASQWPTSIRLKNNNAYGYSGSVGVTGATTGYRFTEPVPIDVDFTMTYGTLTSPIIYDYANTESDGSGDGYGFRINTDYTADFYRKDAGVITVLATASAGNYEDGIRVVMNYNIANDKFTLKAYELGAVNPSDTDPVIDPTHAYPENDYQRFEFSNGNEVIALITDGTPEDLNLWTITGSVCVAYIPSAFTFDESLPPVITGFVYDEVSNRLDALGGLLEYVGAAKLNANFVNSNGLDISALATTFDFATLLSGGETLEYQGTAVLALSTTQITVTTIGAVYDLKIYDGTTLIHHYPCAEGAEDTLHDIVGSNDITLNNFNLDDWDFQDEYHYNIVNGFDMLTNLLNERMFVPIGTTPPTGWALLESFPQDGKSLLPCETKISFPQAPALIQADVDNVLFDVSGNPREIDWEDVINATAEQEVIGIESTVGNDGQGQVLVKGLTVSYQEYTADVADSGTLVFSSVLDDSYYDSLNGVIVTGTGSDVTLTNSTGATADMGVIHMTGQLETATASEMAQISASMEPGTDLQHLKNPILPSTGKNLLNGNIELFSNSYKIAKIKPFSQNVFHMNSVDNATSWRFVMKFFRNGVDITSEVDTDSIKLRDDYTQGVFYSSDVDGGSIVNNSNATYLDFRFSNINADEVRLALGLGDVNASTIGNKSQLEKNSLPTAYEPFKLSQMSIRGTGGADLTQRSLPNGVSDLSIPYLGKNVQIINIGDVVDGTEVFEFDSTDGSTYTIIATELSLININDYFNSGETNFVLETDDLIFSQNVPSGNPGRLSVLGTKLYMMVPYVAGTANDANVYFTAHNGTPFYQISTPIITDADITIEDQNGVSQGYWHLYSGGQISGEAEDLLPIVKYKNLQHGDQIMADTHYGYKKQRLIGYSEAQTGYDLQQIYRALNK